MIITLTSGDGAKARVHEDGAHLVSWVPAGSDADRIFVSAKSGFGPGVSVRGGIPICFPQFGTMGYLPQHGFARTIPWTLLSQADGEQNATATFRLIDNDATRALWPHKFSAELRVSIGGPSLELSLTVTNSGESSFAFTAALHPYFRVDDAFACTVLGLQGSTYLDALHAGNNAVQSEAALAITGEIDRVYHAVSNTIELRDGAQSLVLERIGFPDVVVWNPGESGVKRRTDFHEGDERRMLCVEAATVQHPVTLAPGAAWRGIQRITARATAG